ncbi:hypothetical protein BC827DRAFT_1158883 [Russula dissimulans]|nr:hypothetical protein BC827DRAFT_1158883 [Russula dissimulans]
MLQAWSDTIRTEPQKREESNTLVTEVKAPWEGRTTKKERGRGEVICDHKKCQRILTTRRPGARPIEGDEESMAVKPSRRKTSASRKHGTIEINGEAEEVSQSRLGTSAGSKAFEKGRPTRPSRVDGRASGSRSPAESCGELSHGKSQKSRWATFRTGQGGRIRAEAYPHRKEQRQSSRRRTLPDGYNLEGNYDAQKTSGLNAATLPKTKNLFNQQKEIAQAETEEGRLITRMENQVMKNEKTAA